MIKIEKITIISGRELIEEERERLKKLRLSNKGWWDSRSDWAKKQFGPTLTEKDGSIHPNGDPVDNHRCQVCGDLSDLDAKIIQLIFSFCDEYPCSINICRKCCDDLGKKLDNATGKIETDSEIPMADVSSGKAYTYPNKEED